ncbi:MAG TPA: DUF3109 family protein [Kofleriaceae bacterium]|jgi:hypothetical protein|nr:DUF3109 family protein [Kofleriaceae bacterium]
MDEPTTDVPSVDDEPSIAIDHPKFRSVAVSVFTRRLAPDCMTHRCTTVETGVHRNDVCCQYGCDIDLDEKAKIEARADAVRARMNPDVKHAAWFEPEQYPDADYPSGAVVRSAVHDGFCIFLAHDQRGCVLHRTALEEGWKLGDIKPAVCRLFPLSWETDAIVVADEYTEYSCAHVEGPTLYRITRDTLAELFGAPLVAELDRVEAQAMAMTAVTEPRRLPVLR